ncbi:type VI secretion protein [Sphingobium sp. Leaf26]|uniref:type IV secretion system protein VirB3 n=1 Tax=Sphingobium sp. Leaf26 TaxID=1735693 RepID=UPI00070108B6|nr:type IV secretion system protein VirB3 [Sphingobium sp. Leaf26]KQN04355.1 type VI secretion protein [Sphingobium sp. Leaf26]
MSVLDRDTLFVALARPQMFAGVTYSFFVINAILTTELFLILKSPWVLLAAVVIHAVGYLACLREPRVFELWLVKAARCPRIPNYRRWHCNSYHP